MQLANGASSLLSAGRDRYSRSGEFSLYIVLNSKIRLMIATYCFSPVVQVWTVTPPAFAFPHYFLKTENVWAAQNRFPSKGETEH